MEDRDSQIKDFGFSLAGTSVNAMMMAADTGEAYYEGVLSLAVGVVYHFGVIDRATTKEENECAALKERVLGLLYKAYSAGLEQESEILNAE